MYVQITELASQLALLRLSLQRVPPSQHTQLEDAVDITDKQMQQSRVLSPEYWSSLQNTRHPHVL